MDNDVHGGDDDDGDGDGDDGEWQMMMWMWRRRRRMPDPKTGKHTLCETHMDISQEPFCIEIYRGNARRLNAQGHFTTSILC